MDLNGGYGKGKGGDYGTFFHEIVGILDEKKSNEDAEVDWHDHKHRVRIFQTKNF